ncbi:MAG: glycosyltransferase family 4 protein [Algoriphagus aquaeductus]|uniref:glycosyltransferase family 4 protein n=1 Tax=Algoriphagus aquaeductus TaxID=475299 RepID=UPI00387915DB
MRIVQLLTRPQRRGAEIFAIQLSEELKKLGHEVLVITLLTGSGAVTFSGRMVHLGRPDGNLLDWKGFWKLKKILDEFRPDLVQANASDTLRYGVIAKWLSKLAFRLVYRNANMMSPFVNNGLSKAFYRSLLNQTDAAVAVAEATRQDLIRLYAYSNKTAVIPIGIDQEAIDRLVQEKWKLELPSPYILFMGGLVPEKNPELALDWFVHSQGKQGDLNLIFMGGGMLEKKLRTKILENSLDEKVSVIPNQPNPFPVLAKAKALLLPSKIEGLPAVILEAMYCRVPVVAYGVGGIPEVLKSGMTGWCIEPGNRIAFVQAIQEVLEMDEGRKKEILDSAFDLVTADYNLSTVAKKFEQFYLQILE